MIYLITENTKNVEHVTPKVQQSTQAAPDQSSNYGNKGNVMVKGQGSSQVSGASGIHGNKSEDDEEELVVDTRVKFKEWDPVSIIPKGRFSSSICLRSRLHICLKLFKSNKFKI